MEKNMQVNFDYLEKRVIDALNNTDEEYIKRELRKITTPTIVSGVGGSSVVAEFTKKVLEDENKILVSRFEPRDFNYRNIDNYDNVIACSYSGDNYGVKIAFLNKLKHYLLSSKDIIGEGVVNLKYSTTIEKERSFISLAATLMPISIMLNYYLDGEISVILDGFWYRKVPNIYTTSDVYEIFTGYDTSTASMYLESTMVESGIGIPIVHDKYSYCHGRSTTSKNVKSTAIFLHSYSNELDDLLLENIKRHYKYVIELYSKSASPIINDYYMLIEAMYLTERIAQIKKVDLSNVDYSPMTKTLYNFKGTM